MGVFNIAHGRYIFKDQTFGTQRPLQWVVGNIPFLDQRW